MLAAQSPSLGESTDQAGGIQKKYFALPFAKSAGIESNQKVLDQYEIPFIEGTLHLSTNGPTRVDVGGEVKHIFLLGMTDSTKGRSWAHPQDYPARFLIKTP